MIFSLFFKMAIKFYIYIERERERGLIDEKGLNFKSTCKSGH